MRLVRNEEVRALAARVDLAGAVRAAFLSSAAGKTALQPRQRIAIGGVKLSTMSAILPDAGIAGAKVYTTVEGRFAFVVLLFDSATGQPLACMEADAFTELRTAAVTEVVAEACAPNPSGVLAVFGTGVQARSHIRALTRRFSPEEVRVVSRRDAAGFCRALGQETGARVVQAAPDAALDGAAMVVTATRAAEPLFDGARLAPGSFVAAVGSTLPAAREIDGATLARATVVLVEDAVQSFAEAGGLILAEREGLLDRRKVVGVADALTAPKSERPSGEAIVVFESVGIALEDVAVAAAVYRELAG